MEDSSSYSLYIGEDSKRTGLPVASDSARVLVLGDGSAGKTSLIHLLCYKKILTSPPSTIGCHLEMKAHEFKTKSYWIEFLEVGGRKKFETTRTIFYSNIHGIILVHDLTNRNSFLNLKNWLSEVSIKLNQNWKESDFDLLNELELKNSQTNTSIPVLIIGNKLDCRIKSFLPSSKEELEEETTEGGHNTLRLSSHDIQTFSEGVFASNKMNSFLDKVIQNRLGVSNVDTNGSRNISSTSPQNPDSRRNSSSWSWIPSKNLESKDYKKD